MRILLNILCTIGAILALVLGAAFAFVELRALFAQDWQLAYLPTFALLRYIARSVYFVSMASCGVTTLIMGGLKKTGPLFYFGALYALFAASFLTLAFDDWYFALAIIVANAFMTFGHTLRATHWD